MGMSIMGKFRTRGMSESKAEVMVRRRVGIVVWGVC